MMCAANGLRVEREAADPWGSAAAVCASPCQDKPCPTKPGLAVPNAEDLGRVWVCR